MNTNQDGINILHLNSHFRLDPDRPKAVAKKRRKIYWSWKICALSTLLFLSINSLNAQDEAPVPAKAPIQLGKTIVSDTSDPLAPPTVDDAARELSQIAGSANAINSTAVERGRVGTAADVLAFQPGVFAQSTGGQDALRVSIRGSGINRGQGSFREGITFLFDGLPVTGPGGTPYELFEPLGLEYTEILRGPSGFKYGGLELGGAINYVTKTGYDASVGEIRFEAGSFGYEKAEIASGGVDGKADYYVSVIGTHRSGFQRLTHSKSFREIANFGYKLSDRLSTRLYVRYGYTDFENPGNLTLKQLIADPTQANAVNIAASTNPAIRNTRVQPGSTWIGSKTTLKIDGESTLEFGAVFHDYPIDIKGAPQRSIWADGDVTASLKYTRDGELFGKKSDLVIGYTSTTHVYGNVQTYSNNTLQVLQKDSHYEGSGNYVVFAGDDLEVSPDLWLTGNVQAAYIRRHNYIVYPVHIQYTYNSGTFAPRVGFRYAPTKNFEVYSNLSRAVEPADSWKYSGATTTTGLLTDFRHLRNQSGTTLEVGTQAHVGIFEGSLTVYRSWNKDELLSVQLDPNDATSRVNFNASPTIHQGIEAGLDTSLWKEGGLSSKSSGQELSFRQAFTLNDFYYRNDARFGSNQLPGLPREFYQGEFFYQHPSGFYASVGTQVSSGYFVDYDNTFSAPAYAIYNAKIGYTHPKKGWEVYLDFRNLADKHYVVAVSPSYTTRTAALPNGGDAAVFQPGDGFSVFGGVNFKF